MKSLILDTQELQVIEKSRAKQIKDTFEPMTEMLNGFEVSYNHLLLEAEQGITKDVTKKAKRLRIDIARVRIETGKIKDKQKEYIKLEDKAIMGVHNILVWAVKEKEDKLKEIERHFEIQLQKEREANQFERVNRISAYISDAHERDFTKFSAEEFEYLLSMKKKEQEDNILLEQKLEKERLEKEKAEAEERKRIVKENEILKAEAEERERVAKIESEKRAKEEKERKAKEDAERKLRAEKELKERLEREKLESELKAKKEAELKAKADEEARVQAELGKGDVEKVKDLITDLEALKTKYVFKSSKNKKMYDNVQGLIDKTVNFINQK